MSLVLNLTEAPTLLEGVFARLQGSEDAAAAYNVGEIFFSNQKIDEAIAYLELAVKIKSDWPKAYHRLENLKKFIELDPHNPEAASVKAAIAAIEQIKK
jgi:tetratricopeptide (TPR) repeat protein